MPAAGDDGFEVEAGAGAGAGSGAAAPPVGTGRGLETVETDAGAGEGAGAAMGADEGAAGSLAGEGAGPGAGSMRFDGLSLKLKAATSGVKSLAWWALACWRIVTLTTLTYGQAAPAASSLATAHLSHALLLHYSLQ